jgi:hypothetical protein
MSLPCHKQLTWQKELMQKESKKHKHRFSTKKRSAMPSNAGRNYRIRVGANDQFPRHVLQVPGLYAHRRLP